MTFHAAPLRRLTDRRHARIEMASGFVEITLDDQNHTTMAGPVDFYFSGRLPGQEGPAA